MPCVVRARPFNGECQSVMVDATGYHSTRMSVASQEHLCSLNLEEFPPAFREPPGNSPTCIHQTRTSRVCIHQDPTALTANLTTHIQVHKVLRQSADDQTKEGDADVAAQDPNVAPNVNPRVNVVQDTDRYGMSPHPRLGQMCRGNRWLRAVA